MRSEVLFPRDRTYAGIKVKTHRLNFGMGGVYEPEAALLEMSSGNII